MYSLDQLNPLVERIYDAAVDPMNWPRALAGIAEVLGGRLPVLFHHDTNAHTGNMFVPVGYDPTVSQAYNDYYAKRNIWLRKGELLLRTERVRTSHMMCSRRDLIRSEFFAGWLSQIQVNKAIGATLLREGSQTSNITLMAGRERADFAHEDMVFLDALFPHLQRALQVHTRMAEIKLRNREFCEALDGLSVGVLLVTARCKVLFMNATAQSIIAKKTGLAIDVNGLKALRSDDTSKLRSLIGGAAHTTARRGLRSGGTMKVARPGGAPPLELLVSPVHIGDDWHLRERAVAVVYVTDPHQAPRTQEAMLRRVYGLTAREAKVFAELARGASAKQAAKALDISYNTVKTHLRHIFTKTNTKSQLELARLANRCLAHLSTIETT